MQTVLGPDVHHLKCCHALSTLNSVGLVWFAYSIFKFYRYGILHFFNFRMLVHISNSIFYFFVKQQKENNKKAFSKLLKQNQKPHHQHQKSLVHRKRAICNPPCAWFVLFKKEKKKMMFLLMFYVNVPFLEVIELGIS